MRSVERGRNIDDVIPLKPKMGRLEAYEGIYKLSNHLMYIITRICYFSPRLNLHIFSFASTAKELSLLVRKLIPFCLGYEEINTGERRTKSYAKCMFQCSKRRWEQPQEQSRVSRASRREQGLRTGRRNEAHTHGRTFILQDSYFCRGWQDLLMMDLICRHV